MASRMIALVLVLGWILGIGAPGWGDGASPEDTAGHSQPHWQVYSIHPWIEADAEQLSVLLRTPATGVDLSGPRNDWLTGAVAIGADQDAAVEVSLDEPEALRGHIQLRVVGQVRERINRRIVWDPLISKEDLPEKATKARNFQYIRDFPRLMVTPKVPAFLWLTVDLRGIPAGNYSASLQFMDPDGNSRKVPISIAVLNAELPKDSPLYGIAWHWTNSPEMIRDFVEHGINVAFRDHEMAWKCGAKFLLFQLPASFGRKPIDDAKHKEVAADLDRIYATVKRLGAKKGQWAIYPADEPSDESAPLDLAYARLIRKLHPDAPLWYNPSWIMDQTTHRNRTTVAGTMKVLASVANYWCPYCWHLWDSTGALKFMKSTGKPVWFYEIWEASASRRPSVGREILRKGAWMAWKYNAQGLGVFSANDTANDVWDDLDPDSQGYANYSFTYPGAKGVMSSRGFEALRQGIQEYKRLYVLKSLGADPALLDAWAGLGASAKSVETFDTIREQMDQLLVKLSARKATARSR